MLRRAALVADGHHARTDGLVSLGVVLSALVVSLGFPLGDPLMGLAITAIILRVAWQSLRMVVRARPPCEHDHPEPGGPERPEAAAGAPTSERSPLSTS